MDEQLKQILYKWLKQAYEMGVSRDKFSDQQSECDLPALELSLVPAMATEIENTRPSPWIKITPETLPEKYRVVLVLDALGIQNGWYEDGKWYTDDNAGQQSLEILHPTHYTPIPPLPERQ